jgi:transcriptional regulator GlxA family with amidase domain
VEDESLRRALNFIARHLTEPFTIEDVVGVSGASRRSLYNKFNGYLGHSIQREIMRQRLNRAKQMLCNTREKVQSVAAACGFEDGMSLAKAFRSYENVTPSQLRVQ